MASMCPKSSPISQRAWPKLSSQRAEQLSHSLPPLLVKAERIAATVTLGVHGRRRAGPGENFWQYRNYSFGDSTQRIDWHRSAKSDAVYIRDNEWEAANTLWLWSNAGPRMNFKSHLAIETKREAAQTLQLALASLAIRAHERIGAIGSFNRAGHGRAALRQMSEHCELQGDQPLPKPTNLQRQSATVLISDFLDDPIEIKSAITSFAQTGVRGHIVQIADPAEESLPYEGRIEFLGLDIAQKFLATKTENLREKYVSAYQAQRETVKQLAQRLGWSFTIHRTDQPLTKCLLALHAKVSEA
jgi:uncharacterized protein (DUF58 family)